ncbi:MAG: FG-GAP repeat domain-containing protein, partial [bacterium]
DLFITRWRGYALWRNRGDGTFEDLTEWYGLAGDRDWPTSSAFADLDNDGDLDLYVCHYMEWVEGKAYPCIDPSRPGTYDCRPRDFPAMKDHLFRNDGGKFTDVSESAGIFAADLDGRGLGVVAVDVNDDNMLDLFVANDTTANFLFINKGGMKFEEMAFASGVAANAQGGFQAGMGVAAADVNCDGLVDLAVTNFYNESTSIFQNLGGGFFADRTSSSGVAAASRNRLGFGIAFGDFDNNGSPDLITANGHVTDGRPTIPFRMPLQLFQNQSKLHRGTARKSESTVFMDSTKNAGEVFSTEWMARGLVLADFDQDGALDALVQSQGDPLLHLKNVT